MATSERLPTNYEADGRRPTGEGLDLWALLEALRYRWGIVLIILVLTCLAGAGWVFTRPDTYSTETLVQKRAQSSPLSDPANQGYGEWIPSQSLASEVELLRSQAVLGPVVERLRLTLTLPGDPHLRDTLLSEAQTDPVLTPGAYVLRRNESRLQLLDAEGLVFLDVAGPGDTLSGPGFDIPIDAVPELTGEVRLEARSAPDAIAELGGALQITQIESTNLIRIRYTARAPEHAAEVVNTVAESYQEQAASAAIGNARRRREFLAGQLAQIADSVGKAQADLADYQERSRVLDPATEGERLAQSLREQELQVRQMRYQESLLESLVATLSGEGAGEGVERIMTLSEEMVPGGAAVYDRLRGLETERSRLTADRYGYQEGSSRVAVVDSLILMARRELLGLTTESLDLGRTRLQEAQQEASSLRRQVGALPGQATAIGQLEQNAEAILSTMDLLTGRYYEAQIAEAVITSDVEVVEYAAAPLRPDARSMVRPLLLALLMGLAISTLVVVLLERLDTTVHLSGDAEKATGLAILGMVPRLAPNAEGNGKNAPAPLVVRYEHVGSEVADAFRTLPTMIRFARTEAPEVLAVVSQGPREGKSFAAANLALAMATSDKTVLLVDCDLRRPRQDTMFEIERSPGVTDFLVNPECEEPIYREMTGRNLWVLPAGSRVPDPAALISSGRMAALVKQARERFDTVIFDTPPVLAASEVLTIASLTDGVIVVARAEKTDRRALSEATDRLRQVRAPLLGLVLNDVVSGSSVYGGYYYRYYSYEEYGDDEGQKGKRRKRRKRVGDDSPTSGRRAK